MRGFINEDRLREILTLIKNTRIGLIGDFALDVYWEMDPNNTDISVETGLPTRRVLSMRVTPGGAGNVAENLVSLGVKKICIFGIIGDDMYGREMRYIFNNRKIIDTTYLICQRHNWNTAVYTKPYLNHKEENRIDIGQENKTSKESIDALVKGLYEQLPHLDALIINQQFRSPLITDEFIERLNLVVRDFPNVFFIADVRDIVGRIRGIAYKMNAFELARFCGVDLGPFDVLEKEEVIKYGKQAYKKINKPLFITRGEAGIIVIYEDEIYEVPGLFIIGDVDPVGAGDTVVATIGSAIAAGANLEESAILGNLAAGVTVQKLQQCGTASPEEIIEIHQSGSFIYNPELAEDIRRAVYIPDTEIEIINRDVLLGNIKHIIFDHDGTISTIRQGWEKIMLEVMVEEILGEYIHKCSKEEYNMIVKKVERYIEQSTGIQTILQMEDLIKMVKDGGFVPEDKVKDKFEYKDIYNRRILEVVEKRIKRLERGELDVEDYTIKGIIPFLKELKNMGMVLYLASGTDEEDVKREVERLGYKEYFGENIFGALGDINKYPKRMVIERIIKSNFLNGYELLVIGDGPVEIREGKRYGGITIGVASDEVRRFGLNTTKRKRLIRAGSDFIIPDYTQYKRIIQLIRGEIKIK